MPTYEYECTKCGHTFDVMQSIKDKPLSRCPVCKSAIRRVIFGGLGVIFKGSGYYSTDNKKGSALTGGNGHKDKDKSSEKSGESSGEKSAEKPKESKTDTASTKEKAPAT